MASIIEFKSYSKKKKKNDYNMNKIFLPAVISIASSIGEYLAYKDPEFAKNIKNVFSKDNLVGIAIRAFAEGMNRM